MYGTDNYNFFMAVIKFLNDFFNLIYENFCLVCNTPCEKLTICSVCESDFIERKQNCTKSFNEITVYSWGLYSGKLRDGIIELKNGKKKLAGYFSYRLVKFWNELPDEIKKKDYLVIPVPSHKKRIKERGYCQSSLIANEFAKSTGYHFSKDCVIRTKETLYMNSLNNINERVSNIKNAFKITKKLNQNKNILIIDDILTSGSTLCELSKTILKDFPNTNLIGLTVSSGDTYS